MVDHVLPGLSRARWIVVNLVFASCHPLTGVMPALPPSVRSLVVNAVLFVLPAAGWSALLGPAPRMPGMRLARDISISSGVFLASLAIVRMLGVALTDVRAWNVIWLITNAGFVCAALWARPIAQRRSLLKREVLTGTACFLAAYALFFWGATRVVPPQQDQDLEVVGTGFGLLTRFEPLLLTDRHSVYFFAHPPLLHFYVAGSYLLNGALVDLQFYDEASRRVRDAWEGRVVSPPAGPIRLNGRPVPLPVEPGSYEIAGAVGTDYVLTRANGDMMRVPIESVELDQVYSRYYDRPLLIDARTPNIFFAACTATLLAIWIGRISHRWWLGPIAAATYATSPEVFVRSSYGGYFAVGAFASILILLAAERWRRFGRRDRVWLPALTGAFAALVDHKLVVLPAALCLRALVGWPRSEGLRRVTGRLHPTAIGFALGTVLFWSWGLGIAPGAFIEDHFRSHLLDRITHHNPFGYGGYPTPLGLWVEFTRHTGYVLLPIATGLMLWDVSRSRGEHNRRPTPSRGIWLLWTLLTAAAFTVVDWRMTKHLVLLVLPLCLGLIPDRALPRWRLVLPVSVLLFVLAFNGWTVAELARDFAGFKVTPAW